MPYAPGIEYHGDRYAFQGITGAANSIAQGIDEFRKKREQIELEQAFNDPIMAHAREEGMISDEEYVKYQQAPHEKKKSIANALQANIAFDLAQQTRDTAQQHFEQQLANQIDVAKIHAGARTGGGTYDPQKAGFEVTLPDGTKVPMIYTSPRQAIVSPAYANSLKPTLPKAGDPGPAPDSYWDATGHLVFKPQPKGEKKLSKAEEEARRMEESLLKPSGGGGGTTPQGRGFFGSIADWASQQDSGQYGFATPPPVASNAPVHVQSVEEAMKLPPGTAVIFPDGATKRVPAH